MEIQPYLHNITLHSSQAELEPGFYMVNVSTIAAADIQEHKERVWEEQEFHVQVSVRGRVYEEFLATAELTITKLQDTAWRAYLHAQHMFVVWIDQKFRRMLANVTLRTVAWGEEYYKTGKVGQALQAAYQTLTFQPVRNFALPPSQMRSHAGITARVVPQRFRDGQVIRVAKLRGRHVPYQRDVLFNWRDMVIKELGGKE